VVVPFPVDTIFDFRSENLPLKYEQMLVGCVSVLLIVPVVYWFARRTITSSQTLKSSVDNTSPYLNPCRDSKGSEQSFCIVTQHVTIVSVALVKRISFTGKLSSDIPT
jgi:hypothetical protein